MFVAYTAVVLLGFFVSQTATKQHTCKFVRAVFFHVACYSTRVSTRGVYIPRYEEMWSTQTRDGESM